MPNVDTNPILELTDGTTKIDLISPNTGITLRDWVQQSPLPKGDGIWVDSPLTEGRRLISRIYGNVVDAMTFTINGVTPDDTILALQSLRQMLEKATNYWISGWSDTPVYLKKRGSGETNITYALIIDWRAPEDSNPFAQPFFAQPFSVIEEFSLSIEHGAWMSNPPGTGTATQLWAKRVVSNAIGSGTFGQELTVNDQVFCAAYENTGTNTANVQYVYRYTAIGGVWSANLFGAAKPYQLVGGAVGDMVYFGNPLEPFYNLVFDIGPNSNSNITTHWEWYDAGAATWRSFGAGPPNVIIWCDNTACATSFAFNEKGVNVVSFEPKSGWGLSLVNGANAYWIRLVVDGAGASTPQQQNRDVYSVKWPMIEIDANKVAGDLPAIVKFKVSNHFNAASSYIDRVIMSLRSYWRGTVITQNYFTPYLAIGNGAILGANYASCTVSGAAISISALTRTPTGSAGYYNAAGASAGQVKWTLTNPSCWTGTFRVFVRVFDPSVSSAATFQIKVGTASAMAVANAYSFIGKIVTVEPTWDYEVIDLGVITLPGILGTRLEIDSCFIQLFITNASALTFYVCDLILIPSDEWSVDARYNNCHLNVRCGGAEYLEVDQISYPREAPTCLLKHMSYLTEPWQRAMSGPPILQVNTRQQLFVFPMKHEPSDNKWRMPPYNAVSVQASITNRYFSSRGTK